MERIAMNIGTSPATTVPNTSSSTINAAGTPKRSSPLRKSSWESWLKSCWRVCLPVIDAVNAASLAARTASMTSWMPFAS
jgi:hypothetical protein